MPKSENQLECHPALLLREVPESDFNRFDRISIVDNHQVEQQIFLYKNEDTSEYEVRIYKLKATDTYMPNLSLGFKRYFANDEFASFFFETYYFACLFIAKLAESHPESLIRPVLENKKD